MSPQEANTSNRKCFRPEKFPDFRGGENSGRSFCEEIPLSTGKDSSVYIQLLLLKKCHLLNPDQDFEKQKIPWSYLKINMEPKDDPIEKDNHLNQTSMTLGSMLIFQGVYFGTRLKIKPSPSKKWLVCQVESAWIGGFPQTHGWLLLQPLLPGSPCCCSWPWFACSG